MISSAFISSTLAASAFNTGLTASNFVFTCSHVSACCALAKVARRAMPNDILPMLRGETEISLGFK